MVNTNKAIKSAVAGALAITMSMTIPIAPAIAQVDPADTLDGTSAIEYPIEVQQTLPEVAASRWAVMDAGGNLLYGRKIDEPCKIASVTKIMTAIVSCEFPLETHITVSEHAATIPGSSAEIATGDSATVSELLEGLMLPSGNDAAYALAEGLGGLLLVRDGSPDGVTQPENARIQRFVDEMNAKAAELGMTNTFFANPCGLDDEGFEGEHRSTARDVAIMTKAAMEIPEVAAITNMAESDMIVQRANQNFPIHLYNTNTLETIRVDETLGTKTGFTDQAGACFAGTCDIAGDRYYTAVLGCEEKGVSMTATAQLWDWIRSSKKVIDVMGTYPKTESGDYLVAKLAAKEWNERTYDAVVRGDDTWVKWYWDDDTLTPSFQSEAPDGAVYAGEHVGTLSFSNSAGEVVKKFEVVSAETVESPDWWTSVCIFFTRLFAPVTGAATTAWDEVMEGAPVEIGNYYPDQTILEPAQELVNNAPQSSAVD